MDGSVFDCLCQAFATGGTRRRLLTLLTGLPLSRLVAGGDAAARNDPKQHRPQRQRHHSQARTQRRQDRRDDAHAAACIPTGQRCPSKKARGKKGKKLGCDACCQGSFTTESSGKKVCGCQQNGGACSTDAACCSGSCDGATCQIPPSAPCSARTCDGCCDSNGACQLGTAPHLCGADGASCISCGGETPACARGICVTCTSTSQCPAGQICLLDGTCHACDVHCTGSPTACGAALQAALDAGGTYYLCAGTYQGSFTATKAVTLIGAGEGSDPATNTILDARGSGRVFSAVGLEVEMQRLRITGGNIITDVGAGLYAAGTLRMTECTITGNKGEGESIGGGLYLHGQAELTRCTVQDNVAGASGGGIHSEMCVPLTLTDCVINSNRASGYAACGGGISARGSQILLAGSTVMQHNSADVNGGGFFTQDAAYGGTFTVAETSRVTHNKASSGGGIYSFGFQVYLLPGGETSPSVVDNCPDNCNPHVDWCASTPVSCSP